MRYLNFDANTSTWCLSQTNVSVVVDEDTRVFQPFGAGVKGWSVVSSTYNLDINATTVRQIAPYLKQVSQHQDHDRYVFDFDKLEKRRK